MPIRYDTTRLFLHHEAMTLLQGKKIYLLSLHCLTFNQHQQIVIIYQRVLQPSTGFSWFPTWLFYQLILPRGLLRSDLAPYRHYQKRLDFLNGPPRIFIPIFWLKMRKKIPAFWCQHLRLEMWGVVTTRTQSNEFHVVTSSNEYLSSPNIVTEYLSSND